jgi:hypothetical protein
MKKYCWVLGIIVFLISSAVLKAGVQTPPDGTAFIYPSPAPGSLVHVVYTMPESGTARIRVYSESGNLVADFQQLEPAGLQQTPLDISYYNPGIYLYLVTLSLDSGAQTSLPMGKFAVVR